MYINDPFLLQILIQLCPNVILEGFTGLAGRFLGSCTTAHLKVDDWCINMY